MKQAKKIKKSPLSPDSNSILYSIKEMKILKNYLLEPDETITNGFDRENLRLGLNIDFTFDLESSIFKVLIMPAYHYINGDSSTALFEFAFLTDYEIVDMKKYVVINDKEVVFPSELIYSLVGLAYTSARGAIFAKTQGSFLNQMILPFINVKEVVDRRMADIRNNQS